MNNLVEVKITYFKPSGKYYCDGSFYVSEDTMYWDILERVRNRHMHYENHDQPLPGLSCETWDGYALVIPQSEELKIPALIDWTKHESTHL